MLAQLTPLLQNGQKMCLDDLGEDTPAATALPCVAALTTSPLHENLLFRRSCMCFSAPALSIQSPTSKSPSLSVGRKPCSVGTMSQRASLNARCSCRPFWPGKSGGLGFANPPPSKRTFAAHRLIQSPLSK